MDIDSFIWEITGNRWLFRFDTLGTSIESRPLEELPDIEGSACAVFNLNAYTPGILVSCFNSDWFHLCSFDTGNLNFIDSVIVPVSPPPMSIDLTYSQQRASFFLIYMQGSSPYINEFQLDIPVALERRTWGSMKRLFCSK